MKRQDTINQLIRGFVIDNPWLIRNSLFNVAVDVDKGTRRSYPNLYSCFCDGFFKKFGSRLDHSLTLFFNTKSCSISPEASTITGLGSKGSNQQSKNTALERGMGRAIIKITYDTSPKFKLVVEDYFKLFCEDVVIENRVDCVEYHIDLIDFLDIFS